MGIYKLENIHYNPTDVNALSSTPIVYFIRTPTFRFPTNTFIETVKIQFVPATNNARIKLTAYFNNFRFLKTMESSNVVINDSFYEIEYALQITTLDVIFDIWFSFESHTGLIPNTDILEPKQNNAGTFIPLSLVLNVSAGAEV